MIFEVKHTETVQHILGNWDKTFIWSCLQGIMGKIYATDTDKPGSAMAVLGDFIFYAVEPDEELVSWKQGWQKPDFAIMAPQHKGWEPLIEQTYGSKAKAISRYAVKKEREIFDRKTLRQAVSALSDEYSLCFIDERLYQLCRSEPWSSDLVSQYKDYNEYKALGLGVVIVKNGKPVSGASSYSRYKEGIEIEIDTKEAYRRKGFAYICGAELILECLKRGLYPSWDAHNKASLALAEKLGYHFSHEYRAYEISICPSGKYGQQ